MKEKIKISFLIGSLDIGGTEKHVLNLINSLSRKDFDIQLHLLSKKGDLIDDVKKDIKIFTPQLTLNSKLKHIFNLISLYLRIKRINPDIIHCFLPHAYLFGGIVGVMLKKAVIMSRRSLNLYQNNFKFIPIKNIETFLHKRMKFILANSFAIRKELIQEGADPKKLKVIYNGIIPHKKTDNETDTSLRVKLGLSKKDFIFLIVANLIPYKNHLMIVKAVEILKKETKNNFKVIFIGSGTNEYEKEIYNEILVRNLFDKIIMKKKNDKIYNYFSISKVGLCSSNEEGFSNSLLEFLSFGIPVIATDVGGNNEMINNRNGFIISKNSHAKLAEKMKILVEQPNLLKSLSINAKKDSKKYSLKKSLQEYSKIYKQIGKTFDKQASI